MLKKNDFDCVFHFHPHPFCYPLFCGVKKGIQIKHIHCFTSYHKTTENGFMVHLAVSRVEKEKNLFNKQEGNFMDVQI